MGPPALLFARNVVGPAVITHAGSADGLLRPPCPFDEVDMTRKQEDFVYDSEAEPNMRPRAGGLPRQSIEALTATQEVGRK